MTADPTAYPGPAPTTHSRPSGPLAWRGVLVENLAVLVVFAAVGAAAGWVWQRWATPPTGTVLEGRWRLGYRIEGDYLVGDAGSFQHVFGVIGTYAVVCGAVGLVLGVTAALICRRSELVTLAAVAAGSALGAFLCYRVGLALGPADPGAAARTADNGTVLDGSLAIDQLSAFVALPLLALLALAVTYFLTTGASAGAAETRRIELGPATTS